MTGPSRREVCDVDRQERSVALVVDLAVADAVLSGVVTTTGGAAEDEDEGQAGAEKTCACVHAARCTPHSDTPTGGAGAGGSVIGAR